MRWVGFITILLCESLVSLMIGEPDSVLSQAFTIFVMVLNLFIFSKLILSKINNKKIRNIMILAYAFRIVILLIDVYGKNIIVLPNSGVDSEKFHYIASNTGFIELIMEGSPCNYLPFLRLVYLLTGFNRLFAQYINLLFSMVSMLFCYKALIKIGISERIKEASIAIMAFLPFCAIIDVLLLRESMLIMFETIAIYCLVCWMKDAKWRNLLFSVMAVLAAAYLHSGMIFMIIPIVVVALFYNPGEGRFVIRKNSLLIAILMAVGFVAVFFVSGEAFTKYLQGLDSVEDVNNKISGYVDAGGGSRYLTWMTDNASVAQLVMYTPLKMLYLMISPVPLDWRSGQDVLSFVASSMFYLYVLILILKYTFTQKKKSPIYKMMVVMAICLMFVYGWGTFTAGTALRHREKLLPVLIIIFAIIMDKRLKIINVGE